jgi:broad specificity phosphatase PhoE
MPSTIPILNFEARMDALFLFRHGQTDHNRTRRFQGQLDVALNDIGRAQALRTGDLVSSCLKGFFTLEGIAKLELEGATSDLARARDTASTVGNAVVAQTGLPCFFRDHPSLREWDCGALQNFTVDEFETAHPGLLPEFYAAFEKDAWSTPYPGGEAKKDVAKRLSPMVEFWNKGVDGAARRSVEEDSTWTRRARRCGVVSTHGGVIHVLLEMLKCPLPEREQIIGNGDVLLLVPHGSGEPGRWHVFRHYRVGDNVAARLGTV